MADNKDDPDGFLEEAEQAAVTAQQFGKIGAFNLLLGPSAKVLGEHWAAKLKSRITQNEAKRLEAHIDAVQDDLPKPEMIDIGPAKVGGLLEWTANAKLVDPIEHPTLTKAWRKALTSLLNDNYQLLNTLPSLEERTLSLFAAGGKASLVEIRQLEDAGLINMLVEQAIPIDRAYYLTVVTLFGFLAYSTFFDSDWLYTSLDADSLSQALGKLLVGFLIVYSISFVLLRGLNSILAKRTVGNLTIKGKYVRDLLGSTTEIAIFYHGDATRNDLQKQ